MTTDNCLFHGSHGWKSRSMVQTLTPSTFQCILSLTLPVGGVTTEENGNKEYGILSRK